jgi:hypothetical protein
MEEGRQESPWWDIVWRLKPSLIFAAGKGNQNREAFERRADFNSLPRIARMTRIKI